MADMAAKIAQLVLVPNDEKAFRDWIGMGDAIHFLKESLSDEETIIYAGCLSAFLHVILVPRADFINDKKGLLSWDFNASTSWSISTTPGTPPEIKITPPLNRPGNACYKNAEQLVFWRHFDGHMGEKGYFEISQKFLHISELHFVPERSAYCRLDDRGDIEESIQMVHVLKSAEAPEFNFVTCKSEILARYAALTDSAIIRTFDFTRFRPKNFTGWHGDGESKDIDDGNLAYHLHIKPNKSSYMRGVQIIQPAMTKEQAVRRLTHGISGEKKYESFIALDWRHRQVVELSCEPGKTANYFMDSDLPFELSPAFFRAEVLSKYKADSEKYKVNERTISCRGTWYLDSIDMNEQGQVHAYICDLRELPYEEQVHWKAYNEPPKGGISKRAVTNDFEGNWYTEYNPLQNIKQTLHRWHEKSVPWWTLRNEKLFDAVNYPVTVSLDEWTNELLHLDQLVIEGFEEKWAKKQAEALARKPEGKSRSMKLVEECLVGLGFDSEQAKHTMSGLQEVHSLRSKQKGHASGEEGRKIRQNIIKKHRSYKAHFHDLCGRIDKALIDIEEALGKVQVNS
jgi:hypothetical protein